ncbi:unnamed protein product [Lepeophtheirus salmonis]|uniref:(salmon louse) hypothetical protein n=1 Tax=Lepeophtheirus salmonis TaxID=72036 RepID=A0A817FA13_LEPSM|nr:unnamed protein product [Lepeophtheirus salmonis]CAG9476051.1 unnamed protein product [Lepeophtheirus salmonis]
MLVEVTPTELPNVPRKTEREPVSANAWPKVKRPLCPTSTPHDMVDKRTRQIFTHNEAHGTCSENPSSPTPCLLTNDLVSDPILFNPKRRAKITLKSLEDSAATPIASFPRCPRQTIGENHPNIEAFVEVIPEGLNFDAIMP